MGSGKERARIAQNVVQMQVGTIAMLELEVRRLRVVLDTIPMDALRLMHDRSAQINAEEFEAAWDEVHAWLFPDDEPDDVPHAINPFVDGDE